jgi:hypothetical protein
MVGNCKFDMKTKDNFFDPKKYKSGKVTIFPTSEEFKRELKVKLRKKKLDQIFGDELR